MENVKIRDYIESGILEAYIMGSASEAEIQQLMAVKEEHPEVADALFELELDLERIAQHMAILPPPGVIDKIQGSIGEIVKKKSDNQFIEVESSNSHMRIHKAWRWVFAAVFILGKIFLAFAIYYYLENRQLVKEVQKLENKQQFIK